MIQEVDVPIVLMEILLSNADKSDNSINFQRRDRKDENRAAGKYSSIKYPWQLFKLAIFFECINEINVLSF